MGDQMPGHLGCPSERSIETAVLASWWRVTAAEWAGEAAQGWRLHFSPDLAMVPMTHQSYFPGLNFVVVVLENGRGKGDSPESLLLQGELLLAGAKGLLAEPKPKPFF